MISYIILNNNFAQWIFARGIFSDKIGTFPEVIFRGEGVPTLQTVGFFSG
jgi:hypothetical protein